MNETSHTTTHSNVLYPIFLKADRLRFVIVGGGEVGLEKITFLLKSSPNAKVFLVAREVSQSVVELLDKHPSTQYKVDTYKAHYLDDCDIAIAATNDEALNKQVHADAKSKGKIVNVADTPPLCDFYMGSIITKGDLKIAVSTNGKSPTFAKRFREVLEDILPDDTQSLITNLSEIKKGLKGSFTYKVKKLNQVTKDLVEKKKQKKVWWKPWIRS